MSLLIDEKYVKLISYRLERFREVSRYLYNFRCPLCGDSKKDKTKTRGYIYHNHGKNYLSFKCHNCGESMKFGTFLRKVEPNKLTQEYIAEKIKGRSVNHSHMKVLDEVPEQQKRFIDLNSYDGYEQLNSNSKGVAINYLVSRGISHDQLDRFGYVDECQKMTNFFIPGKFENLDNDYPAIIIPLTNEEGKTFGYQCRNLDPNCQKKYRYMTIMTNKALKNRFFGLDRINLNEKVYVVEGPFDSCFLDNALASCGSDLKGIKGADNIVFIFDCEPRNKEIVKIMKKKIEAKKNVVILPVEKYEGMDLNDIVLEFGFNKKQLKDLIDEYTFSGLEAIIRFNKWKRI